MEAKDYLKIISEDIHRTIVATVDDEVPFVIKQENCLHCGNCMTACPVGAVERR